jgi:hypothetical protein
MPGCCPPQPAFRVGNVYLLYPQALEETGLNSPSRIFAATNESAGGQARSRANHAWHAPATERTRHMEWLAIGLPHNSSHLFARLPFNDAVQLAALVGTGQMTWPEVNAALDAKIKLAIAQLRARRGERRPPAGPHEAWEDARRAGEDEIWARYHAQCDAVFADDATVDETDLWSPEAMRDRERILNRLRDERDRARAALSCCLGPQPPRQTCAQPPAMQLTAGEHDAVRKLDASGFVSSTLMVDAIWHLATPLADSTVQSA